jgi:signal peptidase I
MYVLLLGVLLAVVYLVINLVLPAVPVHLLVKTYLFQPVLWGLFILAVRFLPGNRTLARDSLRNSFLKIVLGIGLLQVFFYALGGLFSGFGKNPSSLTPLGMTENLFFVGSMLVGMELGRVWLVTRFGKHQPFVTLTLVALIFTIISIPLNLITGFELRMQSVNLVISSWLPLLAENLLASYLALLAGARVSLAYRAVLAAFWWFCPILPNLNWSLKGLIGAALPVLGMIALSSYYSSRADRGKPRRWVQKASFPAGWVVTALISVVIVWFAVGIFPFQPSVVPTGSMIPTVQPGDVVIVAKAPASSVKKGDIIEYRNAKQNINIVHRVIEVRGDGSEKTFITKGDNNTTPDFDPVPGQNVIGKVVFNVPRIGWLSIMVKSLLNPGV